MKTLLSNHGFSFKGALVVLVLFFAGCSSPSKQAIYKFEPVAPTATTEAVAKYLPHERVLVNKHCLGGEPKLVINPPGEERLITRAGYALLFSAGLHQPIWVAEHHTQTDFEGSAIRRDDDKRKIPDGIQFLPDPMLPESERVENKDYKGFGYDRGHMACAAMFKHDQTIQDESFYYSNMVPQVGEGFNQAIWKHLETLSRNLISSASEGWVISGIVYATPDEKPLVSGGGNVSLKTIGKTHLMPVPTHCFKIVVTKNEQGELSCVAFLLKNAKHNVSVPKNFDWSPYVRKVDVIEKLTGLDFFPNLSTATQNRLEGSLGTW